MGYLNAVDYATGAHEAVLRAGDALPDPERLKYGAPVPRGEQLHALVIDDHIGLVSGTGIDDPRARRMASTFDKGTEACDRAGLPQHASKRVRGKVDATVLGAEVVNGESIGSEWVRRLFLSVISIKRNVINTFYQISF